MKERHYKELTKIKQEQFTFTIRLKIRVIIKIRVADSLLCILTTLNIITLKN